MVSLKVCARCKQEKQLIEFHLNQGRTSSKCKECHKQAQKEYRKRKPESAENRRRRYISESLKSGMRYRVGLKYVLDMPTDTHAKCAKCRQWKTLDHFRLEEYAFNRTGYRRTNCRECGYKWQKARYVPAPPRPKKTEEEKREEYRIDSILSGDGCCFYCGEIDFWKLNNHHPWKKIDPDFTITLCENHHALCTRRVAFLLEEWN